MGELSGVRSISLKAGDDKVGHDDKDIPNMILAIQTTLTYSNHTHVQQHSLHAAAPPVFRSAIKH